MILQLRTYANLTAARSIDEFGIWQRALTEAEIEEAMKGFLSVSPKDKVATTWADIKHRAITDE